ncbi:siderophore synthetase component [Streptosporangium becharense]|uniref:Siderophore synthetase component n=1 Tax=Streptosporangium becharense TaxID=1816182 RepID=A0A7W9IJF3_9ACTN|nr:IucA/IucC family protein [Streptosporangium becharense]MBB2913553.1 siderophore synthetase component [Streptosporangium becharense]MBB5821243.1 siderophore synthetase component [Streptosporangium becharense]
MTSLTLGSPVAVAEEASLAALLRCCVREVAGPRGQVWHAEPYVLLRVAGTLLRARTHGGLALRFEGPVEWLEDGSWQPLPVDLLVRLVEAELGGGNDEFAAQVSASRDVMAASLAARRDVPPPADPWLASEQELVFGHPFHPSPKARDGAGWLRYAPEAHASFPLRLLGVRDDVLAEAGDAGSLDALGQAPPGYRLLPAHPWQLELLAADLAAPLADGRLVDLGVGTRPSVPTSSVRTVYEPLIDRCLKFSLDVRITNCLRKNSWYELAGAVELSRRLEPVFRDLSARFPGTRWLPEPGYRSADLGTRLLEGLGVIVRASPWSVCRPGVTPLLSGAVAAGRSVPGVSVTDPAGWWRAYVECVAPPVLEAYFTHGVVLEPHLQNVLIGVDEAGLPVEAVFRDMEGTKLVAGRHDLSGLPGRVAEALTYDEAGGWNRVVYCLMVNHLAEVAASLAGTGPTRDLWAVAGEVLAGYAHSWGWPAPLSELLAGAPLPAKANLSVRWARTADRSAGYVPVANPLVVLS